MIESNVEYLLNQVKYAGFGESFGNEIKANMEQLPADFKVMHTTKINNDDLVTALNFNKSTKSDLYFFNSYTVAIKQESSPDISEQRFRINNKGQSITLREAYNMMNGRAVHKELTNKNKQVYKSWVMLDYKNTDKQGYYQQKMFFDKYGYDLDKALSRYPIKDIKEEPNRTNLIQSLEKGNRQETLFEINGKELPLSIEANPNTRGINIYDAKGQRLDYKQFIAENKAQTENSVLEQKESESKGLSADEKQDNVQSESNTRRQGRRVA